MIARGDLYGAMMSRIRPRVAPRSLLLKTFKVNTCVVQMWFKHSLYDQIPDGGWPCVIGMIFCQSHFKFHIQGFKKGSQVTRIFEAS